jgi:hypothetical protein
MKGREPVLMVLAALRAGRHELISHKLYQCAWKQREAFP